MFYKVNIWNETLDIVKICPLVWRNAAQILYYCFCAALHYATVGSTLSAEAVPTLGTVDPLIELCSMCCSRPPGDSDMSLIPRVQQQLWGFRVGIAANPLIAIFPPRGISDLARGTHETLLASPSALCICDLGFAGWRQPRSGGRVVLGNAGADQGRVLTA